MAIPLWCVACLLAGVAAYAFLAEEQYIIHLDTKVPVNMRLLPAKPTERDWTDLATQMLADNRWELSPNLVRIYYASIPCQPSPNLSALAMEFAGFYWDSVVPSVKFSEISVDPSTETAAVRTSFFFA